MPQVQVYRGPQATENMPAQNRLSGAPGEVTGNAQEYRAKTIGAIGTLAGKAADVAFAIDDANAKEEVLPALVNLQAKMRDNKLRMDQEEIGDKAVGAVDRHDKWFSSQQQEIAGALKNPRARQYFDAKAFELRDRYLGEVDAHEQQQRFKTAEAAAEAQVGVLSDSVVLAKTPDAQQGALRDLDQFVTTYGASKGLTDERLDAFKQKVLAGAIGTVADHYVAAGRGEEARQFLEQQHAAGRIAGKTFDDAVKKIGKEIAQNDGRAIGSRTDSLAGAFAAIDKKYDKNGDEWKLAREGAKAAIAEKEQARNDQIEKTTNELWAHAYKNGGVMSVTDAQLQRLADLGGRGPQIAQQFKDARERERDNVTENGTRFAEVDDDLAYSNALRAISGDEIKTISGGNPETSLEQYAGLLTQRTYNLLRNMMRDKFYPKVDEVKMEFKNIFGKTEIEDPVRFKRVLESVYAASTGNATVDVGAIVRREAHVSVVDASLTPGSGFTFGSDKKFVDLPESVRAKGFRPVAPSGYEDVVSATKPDVALLLDLYRARYETASMSADKNQAALARQNFARVTKAAEAFASVQNDEQAFYEKYGYNYEDWAARKVALGGFPVDDRMRAVYAVLTELNSQEPTAKQALAAYQYLGEAK